MNDPAQNISTIQDILGNTTLENIEEFMRDLTGILKYAHVIQRFTGERAEINYFAFTEDGDQKKKLIITLTEPNMNPLPEKNIVAQGAEYLASLVGGKGQSMRQKVMPFSLISKK
jgi:hypothetical protein